MATKLLDTLEVEVQEVATTFGDLWTVANDVDYSKFGPLVTTARVPTIPRLPDRKHSFGPNEETSRQAKVTMENDVAAMYPQMYQTLHINPYCVRMSPWTLMTTIASEGQAIWYWSRTVTFKARVYEPAEETP